jgi:ComF family protein
VRRFKYADGRQLLRDLAPLLTAAAPAYAGDIDAVVPVPLHPRKLRQRGWNPAALLARPLAAALGVPLQTSWLQRVRETAVQAGLSRDARDHNVRGAFRAKQVATARVLLVDDVRTTGATLREAASCLEDRGHTVRTLALAWSLHDPDDMRAHNPPTV